MPLSNELISEFVKVTKEETPKQTETTLYGTTVEIDGKTFVRLDGSELFTPVTSTVSVKPDERVTVSIKNHTATLVANVSSPSASSGDLKEVADEISEFEIIVSHKVSTDELEAITATIDRLDANTANIGDLTAINADIQNLKAKYAEIEYVDAKTITALNADIDHLQARIAEIGSLSTEDLEAINAEIENLKAYNADFTYVSADVLSAMKASIKDLDAKTITVEDLSAKYANIDFANIGDAAIKNFYAQSGIIEDLVISEGHITGTLVGVTIKGDLIEGGTVVADKLVIKGEDGLYYKLNTNGETISSEQTEYNSLSGTIITAKSITAEKVNVDDLVAFDATIGGFKITNHSLYSGVKESPLNTTRGVYLDSIGQVSFGDSSNYLRYYAGEDGRFRLEISAESISMRTSGGVKDIEEVVKDSVSDIGVGARNLIRNSKNMLFEDYYFDTGDYADLNVVYIDDEVILTTSPISSSDDGQGNVNVVTSHAICEDDGKGSVTVRFNSVALDSIEVSYTGGSVEAGTKLTSLIKDITVTAKYANGKTSVVTDYTISGNTNAGTNVITVYYGGRIDTFELICTQSVALSTLSVSYEGGEVEVGTNIYALQGIKVLAKYTDGTTKEITDYGLVGEIALGTNNITVTYENRTTTFSVVGVLSVTKIEASYTGGSVPVGTYVGSLTGLTVTATYSDGSTGNVTEYELSGSTIEEGSNTIVVSYKNRTTTFKVTGVKVLEDISVTYDGAIFPIGTNVSELVNHIVVTAHYKDGSSNVTTMYNISGRISTIGDNVITIAYEDKVATINVVGIRDDISYGNVTSYTVASWGNSVTNPYTVIYANDINVVDGSITLINPQTVSFDRTPSNNTTEMYETLLGKYVVDSIGNVRYIMETSTYSHKTNTNIYVASIITYFSVQELSIK